RRALARVSNRGSRCAHDERQPATKTRGGSGRSKESANLNLPEMSYATSSKIRNEPTATRYGGKLNRALDLQLSDNPILLLFDGLNFQNCPVLSSRTCGATMVGFGPKAGAMDLNPLSRLWHRSDTVGV